MILRHAREPVDGQPAENTFEAIDERSGAQLGACTIYVSRNAELFPNRPVRIYLEIQGNPAPDALLGASIARAKEIGRQCKQPCRIFTRVDAADRKGMETLAAFGFKDSDGLVRMRRELDVGFEAPPPLGSAVVTDDLEDPIEQGYFLDRVNQLYNEEYGSDYLEEFMQHEQLRRILIVSPLGMQGEIVTWQEGETGVISWLHVAKKWRGKGVARCLIELACEQFAGRKLKFAQAEIQARIPNLLHVLEHCGFRQAELVERYPGMDMN